MHVHEAVDNVHACLVPLCVAVETTVFVLPCLFGFSGSSELAWQDESGEVTLNTTLQQ